MKKFLILFCALFLFVFSACGKQELNSQTTSSSSGSSSESSSSVIDESESSLSSENSESSTGSESEAATSESSKSQSTSGGNETSKSPGTTSQQQSSSSSTSEKSSNSSVSSTPTQSSESSSPPPPAFNPQTYVGHARWYGEEILGMTWEASFTTATSNAPINIGPKLTDAQIKTKMEDACRFLKNQDHATHFKVISEPHLSFITGQPDGTYDIFFCYA